MESTLIDQWIFEELDASVALEALVGQRIYGGHAPQGATFPYVVFQAQSTPDLLSFDGTVVRATYLVRGIDETKSWVGDLDAIADAINVALDRVSGSQGAVTIVNSVRGESWRLLETDEGREYRHLGGIYKIDAQLT